MHFNVAQERNPIIAPGKRVNDGQEEKRQPRNPCKKINRRPNSSVAQLEKDRAFRLAMFTNRVHLDPKPATRTMPESRLLSKFTWARGFGASNLVKTPFSGRFRAHVGR